MFPEFLASIDNYLSGTWTLRDLEIWLVSNLQRILDSRNDAAIYVANQIDADLVQLGEQLMQEVDIRQRMEGYAGVLQTIQLNLRTKKFAVVTHTASATDTTMTRAEILGPVDEVRLTHQFV